ncbi:MAG TPA: hypothetical protein VNO52_14175, partial [Methylomirabilota bacterium]|nr:hypothetical protein [Methylomirabilota bacterium]
DQFPLSPLPPQQFARPRAWCAALLLASLGAFTARAQTGATLAPPVVDGKAVQIQWNSSGTLEVAPTATGPWTTVTGSVDRVSRHLHPIEPGARFFRVRENGVAGEAQPIFPGTAAEPLTVERAMIRRLPGPSPDGNALLEVQYERGQVGNQRELFFLADDRLIHLNDAGQNGDRRAGDGIFSGPIFVDPGDLQEMNDYTSRLPEKLRIQPVFRGRTVVGETELPLIDVEGFERGQAIQVHPFDFGAAGNRPTRLIDPRDPTAAGELNPAGFLLPPMLPIDPAKSLMITDLSVVEDPLRTFDPCTGAGTPMGAWTFGRLMRDMANTPVTGIPAEEFVRRWLRSWETDQVINFDTVTNRQFDIRNDIIIPWENASGGPGAPLDLAKAPFRLLAIVNRVDLRGNSFYGGSSSNRCEPACEAGEARFVFCAVRLGTNGTNYATGALGGQCDPLPFTVIFEYCVPKHGCTAIRNWGWQWANLSLIPFGPAYNAALQAITDQFATANADPSRLPNRSALNQLRSNEILNGALGWDLREWRLMCCDSDAGHLKEVTVKQTPDFDHNLQPIVRDYINANTPAILLEQHTVPLQFQRQPFLAGDAPTPFGFFFNAAGILNGEARFRFSLNTCNGCHGGETMTGFPPFFTHVAPRPAGVPAALSDFLTGLNMPVPDPAGVTPPHAFSDLARREIDLVGLIKKPCFFHLFHKPLKFIH